MLRGLLLALLAFLSAALLPFKISSAEDFEVSPQSKNRRPKIGLVLEGGGALGFAHVGVLKVLEANRVPIDMVAGTSIGSIVGAAYASGLSLVEMEKALSETDWGDLFGERVQRSDLAYRLKAGRNRELYGDTKIGTKNGSLVAPSGLIAGQNILPLLQNLFGNLPSPTKFDDLPLPFRAVTADLETGEAYVPDSGNLAQVVRASMSVPGVFTPVEMDGRILVDGGIVDNLPVDVVRKMGADVLIVVALDDELAKRDKLGSLLSVSGQMISLLLAQNSDRSRKTLTPADLLVPVDLRGYTAGDFDKSKEIFAKGEEAGQQQISALQRYSVSNEDYEIYRQKRSRQNVPPIKIDFVRIKNTSNISDERILKQIRLKPGDTFNAAEIEKDIQGVFGSGYYTSVRYNLVEDNGQKGIEIDADGKQWLDQYTRLGFSLEDNFDGNSTFRLGAAYRQYNITTDGSYGEMQFEIGRIPRLGLEYYQPFGKGSPYFFNPVFNYGLNNLEVLDGDTAIASYNRIELLGSAFVGRELGTFGEAAVGYSRGSGRLDRDIGDPTLPSFDYEIGEAIAKIDIDKLDAPDFPTSGYQGRLRWGSSLRDLGASDSFDDLAGSATLPLTWGRTTVLLRGEFAQTFNYRPVERSYGLGGFFDISGFQQYSVAASDFYQGKILLFHRFDEVSNPLFKLGFYVGNTFELTTALMDGSSLPDRRGIVSGSVFVGMDTPLLPTYLGFGLNNESEHSFYFAVGRIGQARR